jgi:hypothetical protein
MEKQAGRARLEKTRDYHQEIVEEITQRSANV